MFRVYYLLFLPSTFKSFFKMAEFFSEPKARSWNCLQCIENVLEESDCGIKNNCSYLNLKEIKKDQSTRWLFVKGFEIIKCYAQEQWSSFGRYMRENSGPAVLRKVTRILKTLPPELFWRDFYWDHCSMWLCSGCVGMMVYSGWL